MIRWSTDMPFTAELGWWLGRAEWWRWAGWSACQGQPSSVELFREQELEQRATRELLPARRALQVQKSRALVWWLLGVDQRARWVLWAG